MKTVIEVIPAEKMRYATVGDWFLTKGGEMVKSWNEADTLHIRVAEMSDVRYQDLVAMHEYEEATMCKHAGITPDVLDKFDKEWEEKHGDTDDEPGADPSAPYYRQHLLAMAIENMIACELGVDLKEYDDALNAAWEKAGHGREQ